MDVKCPGCYKITTVFSHAQTVVLCVGCSTVLCQPTGGKARLTEVTPRYFILHSLGYLAVRRASGDDSLFTYTATFTWRLKS
ncbi:hypothetical protein H8959_015673 [Pygathrix nigripes]